ncbi:alpha-galactosidase [Loigolactobacillus coryniformis subsp. coryniformis]|uniref:Alpha-galactosidase n=1 Tax=Loigolactobacillus coryniformis TaxID=1610 RepID=A0A5B8TG29_9LACO|nr:alpha-galactosidase [Loigolactobacillus coryniformis]QEA52852.1 alpha-galactosidase [Loigolactobacillus coryniformis]
MTNKNTATIYFRDEEKQFHLSNEKISYIFNVSTDGKLLQLYYGKALPEKDYSYLIEMHHRPMTTYRQEHDLLYSLEHLKQDFPEYGTTDFRHPAISLRQQNGSRITDFTYLKHKITDGKPKLNQLPATYVEDNSESKTLIITLKDDLTNVELELSYTIFSDLPIITRSTRVLNKGTQTQAIENIASLSLDLPDANYDWLQLSGAWGRERAIKERALQQGIQSIESTRGISSHQHNPFVALKRKNADEHQGEVIGTAFVYSGNFLIQAEVDTWDVTRLRVGINPFGFEWQLKSNESFTTPEAVLVYSDQGLNGMSQAFHKLFRKRLARGKWRDQERPVLINNWEATYFDFNEDKLVSIAETAHDVGIELFVLDDGWFGERNNDHAGLGDWSVNKQRLPHGIGSLAARIRKIGLKFGLWFEPEMINKDSQLYREHPDWLIHTPQRQDHHGRNQFVLNFSMPAVVDNIFNQMSAIIDESKLDYIKWDMNRPLTDVYDSHLDFSQQGEVFHRYVLGVYRLYDMLTTKYPNVLFESCSSGGGRFDPGLLYYAPQTWTSDDSDAIERLKIQYGTSMLYPISSMGAHVSIIPNHQTNRLTPLETRGNVAFFGSFGYELDLNQLTDKEINVVKSQVSFYKKYRSVLHNGTFYRLLSPFNNDEQTAWMVVSPDKKIAIVAHYKTLNQVNRSYQRLKLKGLNATFEYELDNSMYTGCELMNAGLIITDASSGQINEQNKRPETYDFDSRIWVLTAKEN